MKLKRIMFPILSIVTGLFLTIAYQFLVYGISKQTKLSCHKLNPSITNTEYCAYYRATPGFLGGSNTLLIGPSPNRGIVYNIPYSLGNIHVTWDDNNDAVTVSLPGTKLTIDQSEYVDTR